MMEDADENEITYSDWVILESDGSEQQFRFTREANPGNIQRDGGGNVSNTNVRDDENLLNIVLEYCDNWQSISEVLGFDNRYFYEKAQFLESFTWLFWKAVLGVYDHENHNIIQYIERGMPRLNVEYSFWDLHYPEFAKRKKIEDLPREICSYIGDWKRFARAFGVDRYKIESIEHNMNSIDDKCYEVMKEIIHSRSDTLTTLESWSTWKDLLCKYYKIDGSGIVDDMEYDYPCLKTDAEAMEESLVGETEIQNIENSEEQLCEDILQPIASKINDFNGFSNLFGNYGEAFNDALSLIESVTWLLWKYILEEDSELVDYVKNKFPDIDRDNKHFADLPLQNFIPQYRNSVPELLKDEISDWKTFGTKLGFRQSKLQHLKEAYNDKSQNCIDALIKQHCYPFDPVNSLVYWARYLLKFEDGTNAFREIYSSNLEQMQNTPGYSKHSAKFNENFIIMHHCFLTDTTILEVDSNKNITVPLTKEIIDFQSIQKFSETANRYHHWYEMIEGIKKFDFSHNEEHSTFLDSIEEFLNNTNDNGFVYKGYSFTSHYRMFGKTVISPEDSKGNILAYIHKDNVLLHINVCNGNTDGEKIESVMKAWRNFLSDVKLSQSLHQCIKINPIVHVGVIVCDESFIDVLPCVDCKSRGLLVSSRIFSHHSSFKEWYQKKVQDSINSIDFERSTLDLSILKSFKESIIAYMALLSKDCLPSFSYVGETQMVELKKLVFLTGCQMKIFYSPFKHKIIRGGYGSGKSIVLLRSFEILVCNSDDSNLFIFICYDTMSKFDTQVGKHFKKEFPQKKILFINVQELLKNAPLTLSGVLFHIKKTWPSICCHVFIDEFNGSQLTKQEIDKLTEVLKHFRDSHISIAAQSFEYKEIGEDSHITSGFQYDYLSKETDFQICQLKYSLRCSLEINKFVNESIEILKSSNLERPRLSSSYYVAPDNTIIDPEMVQQNMSSRFHVKQILYPHTVMFNQPKQLGHNVECDNVQMIEISETEESLNSILKVTLDIDLEATNLFKTLTGLLEIIEPEKVVICAFNELFYKIVGLVLSHLKKDWTNKILDFMSEKSPYKVLLTDHATIRGFEFPRFIFVFGMERKYMNYRLIECFTRATTNLYLVVNVEKESIMENKIAQELIKTWRNHSNVDLIPLSQDIGSENIGIPPNEFNRNDGPDLQKDSVPSGSVCITSQDQFPSVRDDVMRHAKPLEIDFEKEELRYPWSGSYPRNNPPIEANSLNKEKDQNQTLEMLYKKDNDRVFQEFIQSNQLCTVTYRTQDSKSFLHKAASYGAVNICKLLVRNYHLNVNNSPYNEPTPLDDAVKYNQIKVTKFFLESIGEDLKEEHLQKLIGVAGHNGFEEMQNILKKFPESVGN